MYQPLTDQIVQNSINEIRRSIATNPDMTSQESVDAMIEIRKEIDEMIEGFVHTEDDIKLPFPTHELYTNNT